MLLSELLRDIEVLGEYDDCDISDVCCSTGAPLEGAVYACIKGSRHDGNSYAKHALQNGAAMVVTDAPSATLERQVVVANARKAYALMCKRFYGNASESLRMIATTGTNGKTSVTTIISSILNRAMISCGHITTIKASFRDYAQALTNTTPDPYTLHKLLYDMKSRGCTAVCLEASSHALCQERLHGVRFEVGVFTNLTQDHLDYHGSMERYYEAKKRLFCQSSHAVINIDDEYGERLCKEIDIPHDTYSTTNPKATLFADEIVYNNEGVSYLLHHGGVASRVSFPIPGLHSVLNSLAAIGTAKHMGVSLDTIIVALREFGGIMGRSEVIRTDRDFTIICDYAHTPDGLYNIISSVRGYSKARVIVVFGCGGDRDSGKRSQMGAIATANADFTVITTDNPRSESPTRIIADIIKGVTSGSPYIALINRGDAIRYAISIARRDDVIILAGKGHELYNEVDGARLKYDERKIVRRALDGI